MRLCGRPVARKRAPAWEQRELGDLGIQYCIKSENAYARLPEVEAGLATVDFNEFNSRYNRRDAEARSNMRKLIDSDANKVTNVLGTLT